LTRFPARRILDEVHLFVARLSALIVTLALPLASPAVCAGWAATAEARMACCADEGQCPMHASDDHHEGAQRAMSQAEADACCAASARDNSASSSSGFVLAAPLVASSSPVAWVAPTAFASLSVSRTLVPALPSDVPTHLLLSVFLV
jgi:hypothetical protein